MSWKIEEFINVVRDVTGGNRKYLTSEYKAIGKYPIIDQGEGLIAGYTDEEHCVRIKKPIIVFGDHTKIIKYVDFDFCLGADGVKVLETIDALDPKFFYYYLQCQRLPKVGYSRHFKFLKEIKIPLPPPTIQKQIAEILDKADALRKKDLKLLKHYDSLAQSLFMAMFGDPVKNEMGWARGTVRDIIIEAKYGTSKPAVSEGEFAYLRMGNITYNGDWDFSSLKYINLNPDELNKYLVKRNDIVFNRTNSKELVGKTAVFTSDEKMVIAGYLIRVRTNSLGNPFYLSAYLNSRHGKAILMGMCKNIIGMANINAQELQNISILIPPISFQNQFATQIQNIELQKEKVKTQIKASENLFQALLQKIFNRDL